MFHQSLCVLSISLCLLSGSAHADELRPNIMVIMSDDMGFSDLGCYGSEIETPQLDRLAANGLRFTQFYNTGRCCPTRASLLTGLYPHKAGIGHMMEDRDHPGYSGNLNSSCRTMAEVLRPAGYATFATGKWHVTRHINPEGPKFNWPLQRGFDRFYGTITGAGSFYDPGTLTRDNTMLSPLTDPEYQPETYYYTDAIVDHAARFIREQHAATPQQPFFLYCTFTAAHWPMHALPEDIAKYKGRYDGGFEPIRQARWNRVRQLGLVDPAWDLSPQEGDWSRTPHQAWEARNMEVYAAMIDRMDQGIGKLIALLEEQGEFDNTLILFLQDNGGCQENVGRVAKNKTPRKIAPIAADAIRLDVIPQQNRAGVPTQMGPDFMAGPESTYIAYGKDWANVSNTPFREFKHFVHEGGISTPLIAHWPARIERKGELEHTPGHLIDIMATCVDVGRATYPAASDGQAVTPLEGTSLVPAFLGRPLPRDTLYWEHEGNRAVRVGDWKLVAKEGGAWELYNLKSDRTEMHDLAAQQPDKVAELSAKWQAYAERANVLPVGQWKQKARE